MAGRCVGLDGYDLTPPIEGKPYKEVPEKGLGYWRNRDAEGIAKLEQIDSKLALEMLGEL